MNKKKRVRKTTYPAFGLYETVVLEKAEFVDEKTDNDDESKALVNTDFVTYVKAIGKNGQEFMVHEQVPAYAHAFVTYTTEQIAKEQAQIPTIKYGNADTWPEEEFAERRRVNGCWAEIACLINHPWLDQEAYWMLLMTKTQEATWLVQEQLEKFEQDVYDRFLNAVTNAMRDAPRYEVVMGVMRAFSDKERARQFLHALTFLLVPMSPELTPWCYENKNGVTRVSDLREVYVSALTHLTWEGIEQELMHLDAVHPCSFAVGEICLSLATQVEDPVFAEGLALYAKVKQPYMQQHIWAHLLKTPEAKAAFMQMYPEFAEPELD